MNKEEFERAIAEFAERLEWYLDEGGKVWLGVWEEQGFPQRPSGSVQNGRSGRWNLACHPAAFS